MEATKFVIESIGLQWNQKVYIESHDFVCGIYRIYMESIKLVCNLQDVNGIATLFYGINSVL